MFREGLCQRAGDLHVLYDLCACVCVSGLHLRWGEGGAAPLDKISPP